MHVGRPVLLRLFLLMDPLPFVDAVTYEKKLLYFHLVDLYISIHLYYFCLQYCIVFKYFI
jgi:hypothetical protein